MSQAPARRRRKPAPRKAPLAESGDWIDLENDRVLSRAELSYLSGFSKKTLRVMDCEKRGCPYRKLGTAKQARVVYRLSDAKAWLASIAHEVGRPAISQT